MEDVEVLWLCSGLCESVRWLPNLDKRTLMLSMESYIFLFKINIVLFSEIEVCDS